MNRVLKLSQDAFQRYVLEGGQAIAAEIAGPDAGYRNTRLGIYYNAYRLRLIDVLTSHFAKLEKYAGTTRFKSIASDYVTAHPSSFRNVRWYGGGLPAFLREDARYSGEPVLADLASFEWALGLAFDAPDAPVLELQALSGLAPDQWAALRLIPHPSLDTLTVKWNVTAIWHAVEEDRAPPSAKAAPHAVAVAVWRRDHTTFFRSLAEDEALSLERVRAGCSFGEMCEVLADAIGEDASAPRAAACLQAWISDGWISDYERPSGAP